MILIKRGREDHAVDEATSKVYLFDIARVGRGKLKLLAMRIIPENPASSLDVRGRKRVTEKLRSYSHLGSNEV